MTLSNFVTFWFCSIVASGVGEWVCTCAIVKDLAANGYIFDVKKKDNINKYINPNETMKQRLMLLVPGLNIVNEFYKLITIKENAGLLVTQLNVMDLVKEMNKKQEEEFNKNPSALKAFKITIHDAIDNMPVKVTHVNAKDEIVKEEEIEAYLGMKKYLEELKVNVPLSITLDNNLEIKFIINEENGIKKITYGEYTGDISLLSDTSLKSFLFLSILDKESTFAYCDKLKKDREIAIRKKKSIKQKYINLRNEVLGVKESFEDKKKDETKLIRK